jgi:oligoendopeptidase F
MRMGSHLRARLLEHEYLLPDSLALAVERIKADGRLNQSDEAIDLLNEETRLVADYFTRTGARTIEWAGKTYTSRQAMGLLEHPDRTVREGVWRAWHALIGADRDALAAIWRDLLDVRDRLAHANGFDDYLAYRWHEMERRDYTPADARALHGIMLDEWSPAVQRQMQSLRADLNVDTLRPWDVHAATGDPLKPYTDSADFIARTSRLFHRMHPAFGADFDRTVALGFIDLAERPNTAQVGGFSRAIGRSGAYVFMNLSGTRVDAEYLVHEMGHSFAMIESCKQPYHLTWGTSYDFSETPSSVMEILSMPYWGEYYAAADLPRAYRDSMRNTMHASLEETRSDAFQHWAYTHPQEARDADACDARWLDLQRQYFPEEDWTGLERDASGLWQDYLTFYMPLFKMEYTYGRVAGLRLLHQIQTDPDAAIARYRHAIGLGRTVTTRDAFAALDTRFPLQREDVQQAIQTAETLLST